MHPECVDNPFLSLLPSQGSHHSSSRRGDQTHHLNQSGCGAGQVDKSAFLWIVQTIIEGKYYMTAASILLILDILLTVDVEIERVWKAKFSGASLLFCINRYLPPVMYAVIIFCLNNANLNLKFCTNAFQVIPPILIVVSEANIGALLILRTRALYRKTQSRLSTVVLTLLLVVYFAQITLSAVVAKDFRSIGPLRQSFHEGCVVFFVRTKTRQYYALWFTNIVFNVIVFMCTFKKTAKVHWMDAKDDKDFHPMHSLILVDATSYFLAVMAAKTLNLVMLVFYPRWNSVNWAANHVIDVIMTSHFFLHLREGADQACIKPSSSFKSTFGERHIRPRIFICIAPVPDEKQHAWSECDRNMYTRSPRRLDQWHDVGDVERNGYRSPALPLTSGEISARLQLSVKHAIEGILEQHEGCADIVICNTESSPTMKVSARVCREGSTRSVPADVARRSRRHRRRHSFS